MNKYFVTGIGTDVGKTLASAIIVEKLNADYWKPIQTGQANSDSPKIKSLISNSNSAIHKEKYSFIEPKSPHIAANLEGIKINMNAIELPFSNNQNLVIEGLGGILVPLNEKNFVIELALQFEAEVILVIRDYLGCINHTLLTLSYLIQNNYKIKGLIFNGNFENGIRSIISTHFKLPLLLDIPEMDEVCRREIVKLASDLNW